MLTHFKRLKTERKGLINITGSFGVTFTDLVESVGDAAKQFLYALCSFCDQECEQMTFNGY